MKSIYDVLIIGNGILGLSTALALVNEDSSLKIGVVGPTNRLKGASIASGAMLGCFGEVTNSTFNSEFNQAKLNIAVQASKIWPHWLDCINEITQQEDKVKINNGTYILLNNKSGKRENKNFTAIIKALKLYNEPYEEVDPNNIPGMNPIDDCRPLRTIFLPNEGYVDSLEVLIALELALSKYNRVSLIKEIAHYIHLNFGKIESIETEKGEILKAKIIVLAAGAYSQQFIDQIPEVSKNVPRIFAGVGCSLQLHTPELDFKNVVIRTPNRAGSCGMHIMPKNNHSLFVGASNSIRISPQTHPKARDVYYLLQRTIEQFHQDLHKAEISQWLIGNRPVTIDTFPLIGKTSIPNFWLLTGTYRDGFHDSPLLAQFLAKAILGKPSLFENIFLPERTPIHIMTKSEAIEEFTEHYMSAAYEHSMHMPKIGWDEVFKEMWYQRIEVLYEKLEINVGLPPDILIMLEQDPSIIPFFKEYYRKNESKIAETFSHLNQPILESTSI